MGHTSDSAAKLKLKYGDNYFKLIGRKGGQKSKRSKKNVTEDL